jgi:tripartite-type tricarboxylate transporter receptor subunit TctC
MINRRKILGAIGAAVIALGVTVADAAAQTWPSQNIRIVVPFPAGGLNDIVARLIGPVLQEAFKETVIIDNRPGASGSLGTNAVVTAKDGHTLLMVASSHTVAPATSSNQPYDTERDLVPVAMVAANPLLFVTSDAVPAKNLKEFVAYAKSKPGVLNYASVGTASQAQLVTELFARTAGITMQHVPYRGGAPAVTSLLTGDTQFAVLSPQVSLPQIETGKMRALAAGSLTRDPQFPNIPTVAEQGYPDFEAVQWVGLLAPKGMAPGAIEKLNAEINRAIRTPDMIAKFAQQGMSPAGGTPEKFQSVIVHEIKVWTEVARAADIKSP